MRRREFIALISGVTASPFFAGTSGPFAATAQKEAKVARLAYELSFARAIPGRRVP
jgi:hypothetical protein